MRALLNKRRKHPRQEALAEYGDSAKISSGKTTFNETTKTLYQNTLELLPLAQPVSIPTTVNSSQLLADNTLRPEKR